MVNIEIAYGTAEKQILLTMQVAEGTTARQAVLSSAVKQHFPEADLQNSPLGIFGKRVKDDTLLRDKDRIEIYRPLLIDPKEARRLRVQAKQQEEV